jgi:predicted  nucleic acid-binding Zn-ribbon protein
MDRLESKLDRLDERLDKIQAQGERNALQLEVHISSHKTLKQYVELEVKKLNDIVQPIHEDRISLYKGLKFLGWSVAFLASVLGLIAAAIALL